MPQREDRNGPLDPPDFELPNDDDFELWTVRLPSSLNVEDLKGVELDLNNAASMATFPASASSNAATEFTLSQGSVAENEQFRLLLRDDNSDDDDNATTFMRPHAQPFSRHLNVNLTPFKVEDTRLAPRLETAPKPADSRSFRRSYSHVPQATGLKRRWMPPGAGIAATSTSSASTSVTTTESVARKTSVEDDNDSSDDDDNRKRPAISPRPQSTSPPKKRIKQIPNGDKMNDNERYSFKPIRQKDEVQMNGDHSQEKKASKKKKSKKEKKKPKKHKKQKSDT